LYSIFRHVPKIGTICVLEQAIKGYFSNLGFGEGKEALETAVATLLLITAAVVIACVVVDFAVNTVEQTLNTQNLPQLDRLKNLQNNLLNQTDNIINGTMHQLPCEPPA
jgi:hypothetical protein